MSFKTDNVNVSELFQRSCKYIVPRYQREYVWTETNWKELISDISFTMNENNLNWSHFLGAIVINDLSGEDGPIKTLNITNYEIVDGQQRLTTLYLLFISLYKRFIKINTTESIEKANYIKTTFIYSLNSKNKNEIIINNTDLNEDILEIIQINLVDKGKENIPKTNKLYKCISYFDNEFKIYEYEKLNNFFSKLLQISLVQIISEQKEEIYNIFEVLNARGQKLKQMELLKNHVMKYIHPKTDDVIDKISKSWKQIVNNCKHLPDIDNLITHFCKCYIKKEPDNANSVYRLIKEEISIDKIQKLVDDLEFFSKAYQKVTDKTITSFDSKYFDYKRNKQIRPLLASIENLYLKNIITNKVHDLAIHNLRNFFFLFNLCKNNSNAIDKTIKKGAFSCYWAKTETDFKFIITQLYYLFYEIGNIFPSMDFFNSYQTLKYSLRNSTLKRNSAMVKYVLICLYKPLQNDSNLEFSNLSIEHLYSDDGNQENSSLGNLTLTSQEINSNILKNNPVVDKIQILKKRSSINYNNQKLEKYINGDVFETNIRIQDIYNSLINDIFKFDLNIFNLDKEQVDTYFLYKKRILAKKTSESQHLIKILENKGYKIRVFLESSVENNYLLPFFDEYISL